jgi:hypothetical protein
VTPSTVTVSVLNGTATNGLAGRISNRLNSAGYQHRCSRSMPAPRPSHVRSPPRARRRWS